MDSTLTNNIVKLRALEPTDLDFLYELENNESLWEVSNTNTPYSRLVLQNYLKQSHKDIFEVKQLRLVITLIKKQEAIGLIDLYDFDPKNRRVGVGIVIFGEEYKQKGYASQSLALILNYAKVHLNMHQVYANIASNNLKSIALFKKLNFIQTGTLKDWLYFNGEYINQITFQYFYE